MSLLLLNDHAPQDLAQTFDPEMRFRPLLPPAITVVGGLLILLSAFHCYTAGFGLLQQVRHRRVYLAFVLGLIFLVVPHRCGPRRSMGWPLPIIAVAFMAHAMAELARWRLLRPAAAGPAG